jgi:glycosyltransferase involved in cell wall biosynthesis
MEKAPLISVIVAVYNGAKTIQRCIDSVSDQIYPNKELIIIDGGSQDGTVDILRVNNDKISYWISEPDSGIYQAWNKALDHVKGDWVYFLGADDYLWKSDVFEQISKHLIEAVLKGERLVYGQVAFVTDQGDVLQVVGSLSKGQKQLKWVKKEILATPGLFFLKSLFDKHGKFDETFKIAGDLDFVLRVKTEFNLRCLDEVIVSGFECSGLSTKPKYKYLTFIETTNAFKKNGIALNRMVWIWTFFKTILHACFFKLLGASKTAYIVDLYRIITGRTVFWTKIKTM